MSAPKFSKEFNVEHAKAGAPYCCRDGREATILKWDCRDAEWPIAGVMGANDSINEWNAAGQNNEGIDAKKDLVMLPLGMIDGKPVFVGDEIEVWDLPDAWEKMVAGPHHKMRHEPEIRWPAPAKAYPVTQMTADDLMRIYSTHQGGAPSSLVIAANAAIRHACDSGQLVPIWDVMAEVDRVVGESRAARDAAIAEVVRTWAVDRAHGPYESVKQNYDWATQFISSIRSADLAAIIAHVKP